MRCKRCASHAVNEFGAELAIHFPGWDGLEKPVVWAFPKLMVCLGCGLAEFDLPSEKLAQLNRDDLPAQSQESARAS
jgi:hypothetical protein